MYSGHWDQGKLSLKPWCHYIAAKLAKFTQFWKLDTKVLTMNEFSKQEIREYTKVLIDNIWH